MRSGAPHGLPSYAKPVRVWHHAASDTSTQSVDKKASFRPPLADSGPGLGTGRMPRQGSKLCTPNRRFQMPPEADFSLNPQASVHDDSVACMSPSGLCPSRGSTGYVLAPQYLCTCSFFLSRPHLHSVTRPPHSGHRRKSLDRRLKSLAQLASIADPCSPSLRISTFGFRPRQPGSWRAEMGLAQ